MIIKLVRKYLLETMVFSAKQSLSILKSLGRLRQSIQMEESGFNVETNLVN